MEKPLLAKEASLKSPVEREAKAIYVFTVFFLYAIIGGIVGFAVSMMGEAINDFWFDWNVSAGSNLTYGQQFGLITVPLCVLLGALIGVSVAVALFRYLALAIFLLLAFAFVGWGTITTLWNSQIASHGRDNTSEAALYFPPTAMCLLALAVAAILLIAAIVRRVLHNKNRAAACL